MLEELLPYYERELSHLRELAGEFAESYPKVARRLQLDRDHCEDPHVERLIEAFAFLAARIHRKLDDEYPEIAEAFLEVMYPHFLRPIPSATILQLLTDPREPGLTGRYTVPRHAPVFAPPIQGFACQFRTTTEVDLWPLRVVQAGLDLTQTSAPAVLTLDLATLGGLPMASLQLDKLRFFLDGEPPLMNLLYELLCFRVQEVRVASGTPFPRREAVLPGSALRAVGFGPEEALFEPDARSFSGFRLLTEYFAFPDKFMFVELQGLPAQVLSGPGETLRLQFPLSSFGATERHLRLTQTLNAANFKLGCVPVVNLFRHPGAPIRVTHQRLSYPVAADDRNPGAFAVHAIDGVTRVLEGQGPDSTQEIPPFYSVRHGAQGQASPCYWYATREPDRGAELELHLVDLAFQSVRPEAEVLSLQLTCTNRNLPEAIPFGGGTPFQNGFRVPGHPAVQQARPLRKPTPSLNPPAKRGVQWKLISHLCLDHLAQAGQGPHTLQETLALYNFTDAPAVARQIQGLAGLTTRAATTRLAGQACAAFVRGVEVTLTFDETCYVGSNLFLFATVLERFLAQTCPPNSFVKVTMATLQQEGEVAQWPPRAGAVALI
jgi:type VI secretion system protein ImpG